MTATPRYFTGRTIRAARESDDEIASMDDRSKFGVVFHRLGFGEAIEQELLTDYRVVIVDVDDATYLDWAERGHLVKLNGERTDARSLAGQIGLAKSMRKYDLRRVISFHSRVKTAKGFADAMPAVLDWMPAQDRPDGKLWSKHASGAMSAGERHVLLEHLKKLDGGDRALLANARCLAEGVDVPALDGVAFIDPRRSEVDIIQAVGRAIRRSDTKTVGTIIIPIFIGSTEDPEAALDDSAFKPVWDVVRALRAHDDQLGRQLDDLRRELGHLQRGRLKLPSKIHHDLSPSVSEDFARAFDVRLVNSTTASWEFWFGILERYVASNATARIPKDERYEGYPLGAWVATQRLRREGLHADREARLTKLPGWSWNTHIDAWEDGYKRVLSYLEREGTAAVKTDYVDPDGYRLGSWVQVQRLKRDSLERERYERLNDLRGWTWDSRAGAWEEGYSRLLAYAEHHGTSFVKKDYVEADGYRLGTWVQVQRLKRDGLQPDRLERLGKLPGWTWDPIADAWEEGYRRLLSYVEREGTSAVKRDYVEPDGYALGSWAASQRKNRDRLDPDRLERLGKLLGWTWDPFSDAWEEGFNRVLAYLERHGTSAVKRSYIESDGYRLGSWAQTQRVKRDRLDSSRAERLSKLPGWTWNPFDDSWEDGYARIVAYVERHGTAEIKRNYIDPDGFRLGDWVTEQRTQKKNGKLKADREERLVRLSGWVWPKTTVEKWEDGFRRLESFVKQHNSAMMRDDYVEEDGHKLGMWVRNQKSRHSAGRLDPERIKRLEVLKGWSWSTRRR